MNVEGKYFFSFTNICFFSARETRGYMFLYHNRQWIFTENCEIKVIKEEGN